MTRIHQIVRVLIIAYHSSEWIFTSASECPHGQESCKSNNANDESLSLSEVWHNYLTNMYNFFQCDEVLDGPRPIFPDTTWMYMRGAYNGVVGPTISTIPPLTEGHGLRVPHSIVQKPLIGRSIVAMEFVKKGEIVWTTAAGAEFEDSVMFYRFLESLPMDLSCDVINWAYPMVHDYSDSESTPYINVDIEEGSLMNSADYDDDCENSGCVLTDDDSSDDEEKDQDDSNDNEEEDHDESNDNEEEDHDESNDNEKEDHDDNKEKIANVNIGCIPRLAKYTPGGCYNNLFALRDIQPGEELLGSHGDFAKSLERLHGLPVAEKWVRNLYLPL